MAELRLDEGDRFPSTRLHASTSEEINLGALEGPAVVYFYPRARTPGCTIETQRFNELFDSFRDAGVRVIGVSVDPLEDVQGFADECGLRFPLVSDAERALTESIGALKDYGEYGQMAARVTFLLDANGLVRRVWHVSDVETHADEVLEAATALVEEEAAAAGTA